MCSAFNIHVGIVASLRRHGKTSADIAASGLKCIVNLTSLNAEFLAVNGRAFGKAKVFPGDLCDCIGPLLLLFEY